MLVVFTIFKNLNGDASKAQMSSFLADAAKVGAVVQGETTVTSFANDIVTSPDDLSGVNGILSSHLIPGSVYSNAPESVGTVCKQLFSQGVQSFFGLHVAGGAFRFRDALLSYSKAHHSRRTSGCERQYRFRGKPCMALGKGPCEHFP
jgi:hypothetical protein